MPPPGHRPEALCLDYQLITRLYNHQVADTDDSFNYNIAPHCQQYKNSSRLQSEAIRSGFSLTGQFQERTTRRSVRLSLTTTCNLRTRNREVASSTHTRSTSSNLEQVANLLCAQANSASHPQRDGKWVVATATGWRLVWLIGAMVCLLAAPWVQLSVSADNGWPHNALRHHWLMPISCHFRDCKALLVTSLTHVSGAIASVQTFTFTLPLHCGISWGPNELLKNIFVFAEFTEGHQ